jgi:hypothetical protein
VAPVIPILFGLAMAGLVAIVLAIHSRTLD